VKTPELALIVLVAMVVAGSALALGTVHLAALCVVAVAATGAALLGLSVGGSTTRTRLPLLALAGLTLFTLLQALPLPMSVLAAIAPRNADVWARSLAPFGALGPRFAPISLDPAATLVEALKWATYACTFFAGARIGERRGLSPLLAIVFSTGLAVGAITFVHGLVEADTVYGIYEPGFAPLPWHVGPLLNPNNLSGYLNMSALCGLGLLYPHHTKMPAWFVGIGLVVVGAVDVVAASRGGIAALCVGVLVYLVATRERTRDGRDLPRGRRRAWIPALVIVGVAALAIASQKQWNELADRSLEKLRMLDGFRLVVADFWQLGAGRGAFESVFPAYAQLGGARVYTHAENFVVQWAAEWGVPVAGAALLTLAYLFRPWAMSVGREQRATAAWLAVAALAAQNIFDLALEVPGVMLGAVVLLGGLWGRASGERRSSDTQRRARSRVFRGVGLAMAALVALAALRGHPTVARDRDALAGQHALTPRDAAGMLALLRSAMTRHPAEPYFSLLGAVVVSETRGDPMPFIQRALERNPTNGKTHLVLADHLATKGGRAQALFELRLAATYDPELAPGIARRALRLTRDAGELEQTAPGGPNGAVLLVEMAALAGADLPLRVACARAAVGRDGGWGETRWVLGSALLDAMTTPLQGGPCAGPNDAQCTEQVDQAARGLESTEPTSSRATQLRARLALARGHASEALGLLRDRCEPFGTGAGCLRLLVEAALASGDRDAIASAEKNLLAASCSASAPCAAAATWLGDVLAARGDAVGATTQYGRATKEEPTEARWRKLADAAARSGAHAQAVEALERLSTLRPDDTAVRARLATERGLVFVPLLH
jgi:hypothetical protein